jgi:hypothetical protein
MRRSELVLSLAALACAAPLAALAQGPLPPVTDVTVTIGPRLQAKAQEYGPRDLADLTRDLKGDVEKELRRAGRMGGGPGAVRLQLVITDAVPDHPTMQQLSAQPGLDYMRSVGKGGATIDGTEVGPGGQGRHVHFDNYATYLYEARSYGTWGDAQNTFSWFARDYARGHR